MNNNFWWNSYIGIPYKSTGCSKEGCDCWGLVRLVYKNEFNIDLPGVTIDMTDPTMELVHIGLDTLWDKTTNPQPGDVINFNILGHDRHVGIVTSPGYMLHVFDEGHTSCIEPYTSRKWKKRIAGIYTYAHTERLVHHGADGISVVGKPHPLKPRVTAVMRAGMSLEEIIGKMCDDMGVSERMRELGAACVNLRFIPREEWATTFPQNGDAVIFRIQGVSGGGGGGGLFGSVGSILGITMIVAAAALTWWAGGTGAAVVGGLLGVSNAVAGGLMAVTALGLSIAGMALLNNSMVGKPRATAGGIDATGGNLVGANFLSGGSNSLRIYETIPQVLGIGRMTFDYLGKPYTEQADEYTNYLRAAFTAGYGPVEITDIRNGDTPIEAYNDVECKIYDGSGFRFPTIYTKDVTEDSLSITLGKNDHNIRMTETDVEKIQVVLYWPQGLWYRNERGEKGNITSTGNIRYRKIEEGAEWEDLHKKINSKRFSFPVVSPVYLRGINYNTTSNAEWEARYGVPKYTYAQVQTMKLYQWSSVFVNMTTGYIRVESGCPSDSKTAMPSPILATYLRKMTWTGWAGSGTPTSRPLKPGPDFGEKLLYCVCVSGSTVEEIEDNRTSLGIVGCELQHQMGLGYLVTSGTMNGGVTYTWNITKNDELRAFTKIYTFNVPKGQYEVDVTLTSADDEEKASWKGQAAVQVQWLVMRTFKFGRPFNPRKPLAWFEMRIRATDQISGSLEEINGGVASIVPDYDHTTGKWVTRTSDNPASLFRYVLQGPAIADRYRVDDAHIDIKKLEDWHNYCRIQGFTYFKVVGTDSSMSVYDLLTEIAAAGYAKPVLKPDEGGIWSVWVDEPQTTVMQHFTEHNTWNAQWTKKNIDIPHAIRATFVNRDKGFNTDTVTVYVDGHNAANSTKYENWGVEYFEGVTDIKNVQRICYRTLAYAKLRPENLSFLCAMEHITSQMGDLVRVTNSFVMWGLGSGWVTSVVKNSSGAAVGLVLSDEVILVPGTEYSIRVRRANAKGTSFKATIRTPKVETSTKNITFMNAYYSNYPAEGDLYQFGYKDSESRECLIESIVPESADIARITVCDYSPEIYTADDGPLPDYDAGISLPQDIESFIITAVPVFVSVRSDESVLYIGKDGSQSPRMAITWKKPAGAESRIAYIQFRYRTSENGVPSIRPEDEGVYYEGNQEAGSWVTLPYESTENKTVFISNVQDFYRYDVEARFVSSMGTAGQWGRMLTSYMVIGKSTPPPTPKNFKAVIEYPTGIRLTWDAVDVVDFSHYHIGGAIDVNTTVTNYLMIPSRVTGTIEFLLWSVDTGGYDSTNPAEASVVILPPKTPSKFKNDVRTDGLYVSWEDCETTWPIQHYIITDEYTGSVTKQNRTEIVVSPRSVGNYVITVQAVDTFDNMSAVGGYTLTINAPAKPEAVVQIGGGTVRITWKPVTSSFPIKTYRVYSVGSILLQETAATYYDVNGPAGTLEFRICAVDSAGNVSEYAEVSFVLTPPEAPVVNVALNKNRDGLDITWNVPNSMLPVATYDIVRQWDEDLGGGIIEAREEDYGSTDSTALSVEPVKAALYDFMVRAVDSSGNKSGWGICQLNVRAPGAAFITDVNVIDNNIQIYWNEPLSLFFDIAYYNFGTVEYGLFSLIGRIDARFASVVEKVAGEYSYQICPVDVAGNVGECSRITATVAQPPDFVLFNDYNSLFNGEIVNGVLDGNGGMIIPVDGNQTWNENIEKTAKLLQTSPETLTWKQKIDGSYTSWLSPMLSLDVVGTYTEIVDVGTVISATTITVSITADVMEGGPQIKCKIETSLTGEDDWVVVSEDALVTFATEFRYVRYTFTVYGGMLSILNINYRLAMKRLSDFGSVDSKATDNGEGFVSVDETPDLYGTWVPFITGFSDVQSGPIVVCNEVGKTAYMNFKDVLKPKGFRVYVLDNEGNRVDGRVSWSAYGV